jgi:hypothetical protein
VTTGHSHGDPARQIRRALREPEPRRQFEELKRLLGLGAETFKTDPERNWAAGLEAVAVAGSLAALIRQRTGLRHDNEQLGKVLINIAYDEMLAPVLKGAFKVPAFDVPLPVGRPAGRRSSGRQRLIEAVAVDPEMANAEIAKLGRKLDPKRWPPAEEDDYSRERRRIARVRSDAKKLTQ